MKMKKTMIALAVVSGAFMSGNVMASDWIQNGNGGTVELGGTLTPVEKVTPWSVKVGDAVSVLNAQVQKGQRAVSVSVKKPILFLGIHQNEAYFEGQNGINPQIDYNGAVDLNGFREGVTKIKLPVKDKEQHEIGYMEAKFSAGAMRQWKKDDGTVVRQSLYANKSGNAFYGGVGKNSDAVLSYSQLEGMMEKLDSKLTKGMWINGTWEHATSGAFERGRRYQGYYGGGIIDSPINITLSTPAKGDNSFEWHASLPVVVYYQ
ncbi:hypothetical protein DC244_22885 [Salmonella enterica subsp. enterica serovar Typhimurium]|nr:hypothetical protein [Salmonella enterica subsp. enterica serovar Typhimurium]EKM0745357.1 hypothetical protein [Escherichia coli]